MHPDIADARQEHMVDVMSSWMIGSTPDVSIRVDTSIATYVKKVRKVKKKSLLSNDNIIHLKTQRHGDMYSYSFPFSFYLPAF